MARSNSEIMFGVDDSEYGVGSALDQRGWHNPVQTLDGFGPSNKEAVASLNRKLVGEGMEPFSTDGLSDEVIDTWEETHRWCIVATVILPD